MAGPVFNMGRKVAANHLPKIRHKSLKKITNVCKCKRHPYAKALSRIAAIVSRHSDPDFYRQHRIKFNKYLDKIYYRYGLPKCSKDCYYLYFDT
uniref:Uncharacterized protein n=1 Tax=Tetranychus urticae TaxID=32264 RepID=T1JWC8_TETUR